jgi:hypothetical protein
MAAKRSTTIIAEAVTDSYRHQHHQNTAPRPRLVAPPERFVMSLVFHLVRHSLCLRMDHATLFRVEHLIELGQFSALPAAFSKLSSARMCIRV